jgi:hypothetical protein
MVPKASFFKLMDCIDKIDKTKKYKIENRKIFPLKAPS